MQKLKKYFFLLILLFIASLNFNIILKPLKLATGGTQGLAIIINSLIKLEPSTIIFIINISMLVISYFLLSRETTYGTILATLIYPLMVRLTNNLISFKFINHYLIIFVILSGIICGITSGFIYKLGFSSGGLNLISLILKKCFNINIALTNFILNTIIILLGCFSFGLLKGIYSILVVIINSYLINKILKSKNIKEIFSLKIKR